MHKPARSRPLALIAAAAAGACLQSAHAAAPDQSTITAIESRIRTLQAEIAAVKRDAARRRAATIEAQRTATEAQAEAREATRRANALQQAQLAGRTSFGNASANGGQSYVSESPAAGAVNGVGSHFLGTVGQQKASALGQGGRFQLGGVSVQLGGFVDAAAIFRSRNMVADVSSNWQSIPYKNSVLYHEPEFRGSARSSRLALLIEGQPSSVTRVAGFFEADFKVAGVSSNSNESNSYAMGLRHAYLTVDRNDWGLHVLAGQSWSLLTLDRIGITPRQEQIPLTIDNAYLPGFNWDRNWQLRFVQSILDRRLWAGISFESPLAVYYVNNANSTGVIGGTVNYTNPGGSLLNSTANYSDDIAPDVVGKIAFDPSFGHYELDGVARFLHDRVTSTVANHSGRDNTVLAGGVGGGLILPIMGPSLTFQASGLVGQGIGRYGEAQFPDATISSNGTPLPHPRSAAPARHDLSPDQAVGPLRLCRHRAGRQALLQRTERQDPVELRLRQRLLLRRGLQHRGLGAGLRRQHARPDPGHARRLVALPAWPVWNPAGRQPVVLHPAHRLCRHRCHARLGHHAENGREYRYVLVPLPAVLVKERPGALPLDPAKGKSPLGSPDFSDGFQGLALGGVQGQSPWPYFGAHRVIRRAAAALLLTTTLAHADDLHALMRQPTLHADRIVFVSHGNLWQVARTGGIAARLTADPGQDIMPHYSPDGRWIAFTASYQGNQDVYVMPAGGGQARRLTYHSDVVPHAPTRWGPTTWSSPGPLIRKTSSS